MMPTPPVPVPLEEVLACANACAEWLIAGGYTTLPKNGHSNPDDVLFHLDAPRFTGELSNVRPPGIVLEVLVWLWCDVLPQLDRSQSESHQGDGLHNGAIEHKCSRKLRDILASVSALRKSVEAVAERQSRRRSFESERSGDDIKSAFKEWIAAGQPLRALIEPTGVDGILAMQVRLPPKLWSD